MATWNKAESTEHSDEVVSLLLYRKTNRQLLCLNHCVLLSVGVSISVSVGVSISVSVGVSISVSVGVSISVS